MLCPLLSVHFMEPPYWELPLESSLSTSFREKLVGLQAFGYVGDDMVKNIGHLVSIAIQVKKETMQEPTIHPTGEPDEIDLNWGQDILCVLDSNSFSIVYHVEKNIYENIEVPIASEDWVEVSAGHIIAELNRRNHDLHNDLMFVKE